MKPNEITQRDIAKWTRCSHSDASGRPLAQAATQSREEGDLADARKLFEGLAAKSRLADLGEQTSTLAHELRQPLFSIAVANESLRMLLGQVEPGHPQMGKAIARIAEQVQRAQTIIDRTLAYASGNGPGALGGDIGLAVANAVQFLRPLYDDAAIEIDDRLAHVHASVPLCQVEIEQVFVNILRNAVESIEQRRQDGWAGPGRVSIRVTKTQGGVQCTVRDNGAGLNDQVARSVFEPFFTTKPRIGTGLGLHICRKVLARVGGTVALVPGRTEGAEVEVGIPLKDD